MTAILPGHRVRHIVHHKYDDETDIPIGLVIEVETHTRASHTSTIYWVRWIKSDNDPGGGMTSHDVTELEVVEAQA